MGIGVAGIGATVEPPSIASSSSNARGAAAGEPPIETSDDSRSSSTGGVAIIVIAGVVGIAGGATAMLGASIGGLVPARRHAGQTKVCDAALYTIVTTSTTLPHAGQRFCLRIAMFAARPLPARLVTTPRPVARPFER
jgi:hypothetical protein